MAKDLTIELENKPGVLGRLGDATGQAGVNLLGVCGYADGDPMAYIHVLVEDPAGARRALEGAGLNVTDERDVVLFDIKDEPGELGRIARSAADAGVNLDLVYLTTKGQLVLAGDDLGKLSGLT